MSTVWEKIYKKYLLGKEDYGYLLEGMLPEFVDFVKNSVFPIRSALDIGCGLGKYLDFLRSAGFEVAGIDSSKTAVAMCKELLGQNADINLADMYTYEIPIDTYGLIYSIHTLHHGTKQQVSHAVKRIYRGLVSEGKIYITLPVYASRQDWQEGNEWEYIKDGVIMPNSGPEKGLFHSLFREEEVKELFSNFFKLQISKNERGARWTIIGRKG